MALIGSLVVSIQARTQQFTKGVKKAQAQVGAFSKSLKTMRGAMGALGPMAGFLGGAAIVSGFNNARREIDLLAKESSKLGIATERLAGLQVAAQRTGVDFSAMTKGIQRMTVVVSEAARGIGEGKAALEELGLDAAELNRLSPDKQFRRIAEAMSQVKSAQDQLFLSSELFGLRGAMLINTLRLGEEGLDRFQLQAEAAGLAMSRDAAAGVEEMNDTIDDLVLNLKGFWRTLVSNIAPALTWITKVVTGINQVLGGTINSIKTIWRFMKLLFGEGKVTDLFAGEGGAASRQRATQALQGVQNLRSAFGGADPGTTAGDKAAREFMTKQAERQTDALESIRDTLASQAVVGG